MFFIYLQGRVFDGSKMLQISNLLKFVSRLNMITRGQKSNFEDFILPNKISRIQELSGGFPLELPWIHWGPQGPLPTTDTPSNFKSWIFPNLVNLSYHIVTIALRKKLWSTSVICQPNIYSDLLATIQQTITAELS